MPSDARHVMDAGDQSEDATDLRWWSIWVRQPAVGMLQAEPLETAGEVGFLMTVCVDCGCGEDTVDQWRWRSGTDT